MAGIKGDMYRGGELLYTMNGKPVYRVRPIGESRLKSFPWKEALWATILGGGVLFSLVLLALERGL